LLVLSLVGTSLGLREIAVVSRAQTVAARQNAFEYHQLSRHESPRLYGSWLKRTQFAPFVEIANAEFPIPALALGYIPQGMAYSTALNAFVLTFYYPGYLRPSIIALVDAQSSEFIKQLYLRNVNGQPYKGHAGGAAAWGDHVWVTSNNRAHRLAVEDIRQTPNGGTVQFRDAFHTGTRASIAFADNDMLWIGDFYRTGRAPYHFDQQRDKASGNSARMAGFHLGESEPMGVIGLRRNGDAPAPQAVLSIPDHAQGATLASTGEFLLSTSFASRRPSYLWVFPSLINMMEQPPAYHATHGRHENVPIWVISEDMALKQQIMPSMSEGVTRRGETIYVVFESAALLYRERALLFADYVFSMPENRLIPER